MATAQSIGMINSVINNEFIRSSLCHVVGLRGPTDRIEMEAV